MNYYKKLIVFGDSGSGKTAFKDKLQGEVFNSEYKPSDQTIISSKVKCSLANDPKELTYLNVLEVCLTNKEINQEVLNNLLYNCQCALFLCDLNASNSLHHIEAMIRFKAIKWKNQFPYLKIIIVGNKSDLSKDRSSERNAVVNDLINIFPDIVQSIDISLKEPNESLKRLFNMISELETNSANKLPLNIFSIPTKNAFDDVCHSIKLILLGDSEVGKTSFIKRHFNNDFDDSFLPTMGIDYGVESIQLNSDEQIKLQIWDTAGQERFRSIPRKYYKNYDAMFVLFSFDLRSSFNNVSQWMINIAQETNREVFNNNNEEERSTSTLFLLGNKFDIEDKEVSRQEAVEKAKEYGMEYFEISCKWNINIDEVISDVILRCYAKQTGVQDYFSLKPKEKVIEKSGCC